MQQRGRLVNPPFGLFRVTVHASDHFSDARRKHASHAGLSTIVLYHVRSIRSVSIRSRLLEVRLVLNRVFRVSFTRITRAKVRYRRDRLTVLSLRALRRLATRVGAYDKDRGYAFFHHGGVLVAVFIVQFCEAISVFERQDFPRYMRYLFGFVVIPIVGRARNATT